MIPDPEMIPDEEKSHVTLDWNLDYGELEGDADFMTKCENLATHLQEVQKTLDKLIPLKAHYDKLPKNQQIELDLFLLYTYNSLIWINLRLKGVDMTNHPLKREFARIKATMKRWKEVKERKLRPKVNVEAAKRFVRSGLYDHTQNGNDTPAPLNKRIRFDE